jgi:hypothetical protein
MAQRVQVLLTDDLDGSTADVTLKFSLDGASYEIDLNKKNADKLRKAIAPYIAAGRRPTSARPQRSRRGATTSRDFDPAAVRAWATSNGVDVSLRGRVSASVLEQYRAATR